MILLNFKEMTKYTPSKDPDCGYGKDDTLKLAAGGIKPKKPFIDWGDFFIGFMVGVFGTIILIAQLFKL
jgi:hypothetical protein